MTLLLESGDDESSWAIVGVDANTVVERWAAVRQSIKYALLSRRAAELSAAVAQ